MGGGTAAERWRQLQEILTASWELPVAEREAFWADHVSDDVEMLAKLREFTREVALKPIGLSFELEPFRKRFRRDRQMLDSLLMHQPQGGFVQQAVASQTQAGCFVPIERAGDGLQARTDQRQWIFQGVAIAVSSDCQRRKSTVTSP